MPTLQERTLAAVSQLEADTQIQHEVSNGSPTETVGTEGGQVRTVANAIATLMATVPRGAWLTTTVYAIRDLVTQSNVVYICVVAHTAGTFATDLAAGKWAIFSGPADEGSLASGFGRQRRRGTTAQHASFTGLIGEITINTSKGLLVAHDGLTAGGMPAAREGALDVRAMGAKGDGTTDSTVALQSALDAGYKEVYLAAGDYLVTAQLAIEAALRFYGPGRIVVDASYNDAIFGGVITVNHSGGTLAGVAIDGITIDGSGKATYGIYMYGTGKHIVTRCRISNLTRSGIASSDTTNDCIVVGNVVSDVGDSSNSAMNVTGSRCKMVGNTLTGIIGKGIVLGGDLSVASGNTISYASGAATTSDGIYIQHYATQAVVSGNTIEGAKGNGIKSTGSTLQVSITGNTIYMANGIGYGIYLQGCASSTVGQNVIVMANNKAGIYLGRHPVDGLIPQSFATDNIVIGNMVRGVIGSDTSDPNIEANSGILVYDSAADNSIVGNNVYGFTMGIECSFASRVKIKSNDVKGCVGGIDLGSCPSSNVNGNDVVSSSRGIYVRSGCDKTKVTNNQVLSHSVQCINVYELQSNITVTGNTFTYDGVDSVNVCFLNNLDNLLFASNTIVCPTTVANSCYIGVPAYSVVVGNITSGQSLNVDTPSNCQVANNVTLAPYFA